MIRKVITYPDPVLRKKATPVKAVDDGIRELLCDMVETMYAGDGVGLAAPQVAVNLRVITIDVSAGTEGKGPGLVKIVNPEIISREGEIEWDEGCLSVPDFRMVMKRSSKLSVQYIDENGASQELSAEGLLAVAIQHEIDHLDGKLIIDLASRLKRDLYERRIKKMREHETEF